MNVSKLSMAGAIVVIIAIIVIVFYVGKSSSVYVPEETTTLTLSFDPTVMDNPLVFNKYLYQNPGGEGQFKIRDLQFYISNVSLISSEKSDTMSEFIFYEKDSYHLIRFDYEGTHIITLKDVPRRQYHTVAFAIGVDKMANESIEQRGDLDANGKMAWSWEVGYKFFLFEGGLKVDDNLSPLVYHIGFNDNYKPLKFIVKPSLFDKEEQHIVFKVDVMKLFTGKNTVDLSTLPTVKFDKDDAALIAGNYVTMITISDKN